MMIHPSSSSSAAAAAPRSLSGRTHSRPDAASSSHHRRPTTEASANANAQAQRKRQSRRSPAPDWMITDYDPQTTNKPHLEDELRRLKVLRSLLPLATKSGADESRDAYSEFARRAAELAGAPCTRISLVDLGQTIVIGQSASSLLYSAPHSHCPRRESLCAHTILSKTGVLVVPDTAVDIRVARLPNSGGMRFYGGVALKLNGEAVGTLSIVDAEPRPHGLTSDQLTALQMGVAHDIVHFWEQQLRQQARPDPADGVHPTQQQPANAPEKWTAPSSPSSSTSSCASEGRPWSPEPVSLKGLLLGPPRHPHSSGSTPSLRPAVAVAGASPRPAANLPSPTSSSDPALLLPGRHKSCHDLGRTAAASASTRTGSDGLVANLVRGLQLVAQVVTKRVDVLFRVGQRLVVLEEEQQQLLLLPKGHDALLFRAAATVLTAACQRTHVGRIVVTMQLQVDHQNQSHWLEIECEDTAGTLLPPSVFQVDNASDAGGYWAEDSFCCLRLDKLSNPGTTSTQTSNPFFSRSQQHLCGQDGDQRLPDFSAVALHLKTLQGEFGVRPRSPQNETDLLTGSVVWMKMQLGLERGDLVPPK